MFHCHITLKEPQPPEQYGDPQERKQINKYANNYVQDCIQSEDVWELISEPVQQCLSEHWLSDKRQLPACLSTIIIHSVLWRHIYPRHH